MKCYLCAISCGVGAGRSVGRKKGKKENHFLNSSYNVWKTFVHSIHLSGFHVITPGRKNNPPKKKRLEGGRWGRGKQGWQVLMGNIGMLSVFPCRRIPVITKCCLCPGATHR